MPIYEPSTLSWSSCEYSSTHRILSIEKELVYPWKIEVAVSHMSDVQEYKLARTNATAHLKIVLELIVEGYPEGNSHPTPDSHRLSVEVCSTSTSTPKRRAEG